MIEELKPYDTYRSGPDGLPPLPSHWDVRRTKSLLREIDRRTKTGTERLLSLRMNVGLVDHHVMGGKAIPPSALVGYKHVLPGEIVMNRMRAAIGLFGAASTEGLVSPDYAIFNVRPELTIEYAVSLFKTPTMTSLFRVESRGLGTGESGFLRLYSDRFGILSMPLPPPEEQAAIVRFLDHANHRIDQCIRTKKKLIALLNEQKQAIIHRAVTGGLDTSGSLKPSGVDWTPNIPKHWDQYPLRRLARCENSGSYGSHPSPELLELPVATTAQIDRDGRFDVAKMPRRGFTAAEVGRFGCKPGDILVVKSSGSAANVISGKCGIVGADTQPFVYSNFLARFVANESLVRPRYLFLLLTSYITRERVKRMVSTTTYPNLRMGEYRGALLPVPPLEEQQQILEAVGTEVASIDQATGRLEREIDLLREYRTRLASDVVTGQLDVRGVVASLPDLEATVAPAEPSDGEETDIEDGEAA